MGLWDRITGEFIDIIEWTEPSQNEILAYRFTRSRLIAYAAGLWRGMVGARSFGAATVRVYWL